MSEELKPCPFCGEQEKIEFQRQFHGDAIVCRHCEAIGPYTEYFDKDKAVILWNARARCECDEIVDRLCELANENQNQEQEHE